MSLDVRHVTNGIVTGWYVRDSLGDTTTIDFYEKKEEIPKSIRHYAKDDEPHFWGPDMARIMGATKNLYPDYPKKCTWFGSELEELCIAESCGIPAKNNESYKSCRYLVNQ